MSISVYSPQSVIKALGEQTERDPAVVVTYNKPKEGAPKPKAKFFRVAFNAVPKNGKVKSKGRAIVSIGAEDDPIIMTSSIADPDDTSDDRHEYPAGIHTTLKRSGAFGEMISLLSDEWSNIVEDLKKKKLINSRKSEFPIMRTQYSHAAPEDKAGKDRDDPLIIVKLDFTPFSQRYPIKSLAGKPKTQVLDYTKKVVDSKGRIKYMPATVDGQPIDRSNIHRFLTYGSKIRCARIFMDSMCESNLGFSWMFLAQTIVVEPAPDVEFEDDDEMGIADFDEDGSEEEGDFDEDFDGSTEELIDNL